LGGRKGIWPVKTEWWGAGVVICLEQGADLHTAQQMPLPLTVSCLVKSRLVLPVPFWYRLTQVVPDKGPLNGYVCVQDSPFSDLHIINTTFQCSILTKAITTDYSIYFKNNFY